MPEAQLDLAKAISKETAAMEVLTYAESMLISPDEKVLEWARQQIVNGQRNHQNSQRRSEKGHKEWR